MYAIRSYYVECATPSFINQYDVRPNRLFVEYLVHPREVGMTLWADYRWLLLGAVLLVAVGAWSTWRLIRQIHVCATRWSWMRRLVLFPLCA